MWFINSYIGFLEKRHMFVLIALVAGTIFFGCKLTHIGFEGSFEGWIEKDDRVIEDYKQLLRHFRAFEPIILAVETDDTIFEPDTLKRIQTLDRKIRYMDKYVVLTLGLPRMSVMKETEGGMSFEYLYNKLPETQEDADEFRKRVMNNHTLADLFVSKDEKGTFIAIFIGGRPDSETIAQNIEKLKTIMREESAPNLRYRLVGGPILNEELKRQTKRQAYLFSPVVFIIVILLLIVFLRKRVDIFVVTVATFCSLVWSLGVYVAMGKELNSLSIALPPLLLVISVADSVHLIVRFREEIARGTHGAAAVRNSLRVMIMPCLFTSLTTAAGFGVLCLSGIPIIREFGLYAAIGILLSFFVALTMVPSLLFASLRLGRPGSSANGTESFPGDFMQGFLGGIFNVVERRGNVVIAATAVIVVLSIIGATRIKVETNRADFFKKNNPLRRQMTFVEENLIGLSSIEFLYTARDGYNLTDAAALRDMLDFQDFLKQHPQITSAVSIADFVVELNRFINGSDKVPENSAAILSLIKWNRIEYSNFVSGRGEYARISGRLKYMPTEKLRLLLGDIKNYMSEHKSPNYDVLMTGAAPIYTELADRVLTGQIRSFILVMMIVAAMLILIFRSVRWGLFALVPNVIPVLFVMGVMGWFGVPLNLATMMIASIAIGIAVDDTIHYIVRFRRELSDCGDHREAARRALTSTGRAVVTTTVVLVAGYGVLVTSGFVPIMHFGLLSAITMLAALAADVLLLPALLIKFKPRA